MLASNTINLTVGISLSLFLLICITGTDCAPPTSASSNIANNNKPRTINRQQQNNGSNFNRFLSSGILSNLFRRQTGSASSDSNDSEGGSDEAGLTQPEIDAQKFMDSLPNVGNNNNNNNNGPSTFRERVSDTFGVLREGVNNQFRFMRENLQDTVEDLRETWTSPNANE